MSIPIPEIALFKWVRHRGLVEVQLYAYDPQTDQLVGDVTTALGRAKFDEFKVLLVIGFAVSDLDERAEPVAGGGSLPRPTRSDAAACAR